MDARSEDQRPSAAERAQKGRPAQFKVTVRREEEATRRRDALAEQQNEARANRIADVRRIAMEALLGSGTQNDLEEEVEVEGDEEDEDVCNGEADADMDQSKSKSHAKKLNRLRRLNRTLFFARQLQVPDCLIEVPEDLASSWLMLVRPEGDRCLLLSDGGHVEVRRKNGYVLERYTDSRMPKGLTILDVVCIEGPLVVEMEDACTNTKSVSASNVGAQEEPPTLAECDIDGAGMDEMDTSSAGFQGRGCRGRDDGKGKGRGRAAGRGGYSSSKGGKGDGKGRRGRPIGDRSYAVCDVLVWADTDLVEAEAECRMFWLESRFAELAEKQSRRARALQLIPAVPVTAEAFSKAYHSDVGYCKDSFLFLHREGHYGISDPVTPLALMWRDRQVSRFVVDTPDAQGRDLPERQAVVLELRGGGHLRTADHVVVAQLTEDQIAQARGLAQGRDSISRMLLRCEVQGVDLVERRLTGLEIKCHVAARSRVWADSWGRIAFQRLHRIGETKAVSAEALACAASGGVALADVLVK